MLLEHHIKNRCIRPLSFHTEKEDWAPPWIRSGPEAGPNFKIVELFGEINNTKHKTQSSRTLGNKTKIVFTTFYNLGSLQAADLEKKDQSPPMPCGHWKKNCYCKS